MECSRCGARDSSRDKVEASEVGGDRARHVCSTVVDPLILTSSFHSQSMFTTS